MIRRFLTMSVFVTTVYMAAFGQHVFGREDLIRLGARIQAEAPAKAQKVWKQTDIMLASLAPEAGTEATSVCSFEELAWSSNFYSRNTQL